MGASRSLMTNQPYNSIAFRVLVAILWTQYTVMPLIKAVIERLPYVNFLAELFIPMSIILSAMACLPWFLRHIRGGDVGFYIGAVLVVLFSMVIHPITVDYLQEDWWRILVAAVPMYFIGVSFSLKDCKNDLFWCSVFSVLGMFIFRLYLLNSGRELENDDMDAAYRMLPSIMYLIHYAYMKRKPIYYIIAAVLSTIIFIFGTRGPILCILVYVSALILYITVKSGSKKRILLITLGIGVVLVIFSSDTLFVQFASVFSKLFGRMGFSTRIFDFILAGDIAQSKGREYLAKQAIAAIIENPAWGYGITADRAMFGIYPHNIVLELWCQYGVLIGTTVVIAIMVLTIIALVKTFKNKREFTFVLLFVSMIFVKLMISGTYTTESYFYFTLGLFINIARSNFSLRGSFSRR